MPAARAASAARAVFGKQAAAGGGFRKAHADRAVFGNHADGDRVFRLMHGDNVEARVTALTLSLRSDLNWIDRMLRIHQQPRLPTPSPCAVPHRDPMAQTGHGLRRLAPD